MSLIPYNRPDGREIVLRHHNAIVLRDPTSHRLTLSNLDIQLQTECPTCHQPLRPSSPERHFEPGSDRSGESYVNPDYFRMLRNGRQGLQASPRRADPRPPSSPIRRLTQPAVPAFDVDGRTVGMQDAEFVSSAPAVQDGNRIKREALSPNYFNNFFVEERELGRGGKGVVLLVTHKIDGCSLGHFACKRVPVGDDHAWLEKVLVEVELLAKLSHPNLVSYRHVWLEDVKLNRFGPSVACAFILQQYCNGGDLLRYVIGDQPKPATNEELKAQARRRSKGGQTDRPNGLSPTQRRLPFDEIYSLFKDITSGLAYLHAANYIHRDLKPSNCLLHREGGNLICLISDFGEVQPENAARKSTGATGTISFCAPEVLRKDSSGRYGNFTAKSDIFSLGMILYFMCFGRLPYHSANTVNEELEDIDLLRAEITDWKGFQEEKKERPGLPKELYQLLQKLTSVNPAERPTANEVLSFIKNESSLNAFTRGTARSSSEPVGLAGRRIQNLDSPMPPSTPVPDPTKHAKVTSSSDEDLPSTLDDHSGQKHAASRPSTPRHRGHNPTHSLVLTRSQDGYSRDGYPRSGSRSPERTARGTARNGTAISTSPLSTPSTITTPLLMPPPTTRLAEIRHHAALTHYRATQWLLNTANAVAFSTRLAIFAVKIASLSWTCWPYSANLSVAFSLIALAALDLGISPGHGRGGEMPFPAGGSIAYRDMVRVGVGDAQLAAGASRSWHLHWRRSCTLLALHFLVIWVTSRFGALCAAAYHEKWMGL